jgi:hypothetical protein
VVLHVVEGGDSTMDSPSQGTFGYATKVSINGREIQVTVPSLAVSINGKIGESGISGLFSQHNQSFPLQLTRVPGQNTTGSVPNNDPGSLQTSTSAINGDWQGTLHLGPAVPVVLHFDRNGSSKFDSPAEQLNGIPATVTLAGDTVIFSVPMLSASFSGTLNGSEIGGHFLQNGLNVPLTLTKSQ